MVIGLKWMFVLLILLFSVPNFATSLMIPKFNQIFQDALPGKPLPLLTIALTHFSTFFTVLTVALPVLGILNICYGKKLRAWVIGSVVILLFIGLQVVFTWIGCITPMIDMPTGVSDAPSK